MACLVVIGGKSTTVANSQKAVAKIKRHLKKQTELGRYSEACFTCDGEMFSFDNFNDVDAVKGA